MSRILCRRQALRCGRLERKLDRIVLCHAFTARNDTQPQPTNQKLQSRLLSTRRKRPGFSAHKEVLTPSASLRRAAESGLKDPIEFGEESTEEYLQKTWLSPWVPLPDVACRKLFDLAQAEPTDIHVDLGAGDGRINFHAIDYGVRKSTGIDIDESVLKLAHERLAKRHPPPDMEFIEADLLDETHEFWEKVQECSILTMHLPDTALDRLRPILERKLAGRKLKILTAGYEMPGWDSSNFEVVLGTQIHMYQFGEDDDDEDDDEFNLYGGVSILGEDDILKGEKPKSMRRNPLESKKFEGSNIIDRTTGRRRSLDDDDYNDDDDDGVVSSDDEE